MKKLTNYTPGARGINLKDGTTAWIEPGETLELDPKDIVEPLPHLGKKPAKSDDADDEGLTARVAELEKQVETLTKPPAK